MDVLKGNFLVFVTVLGIRGEMSKKKIILHLNHMLNAAVSNMTEVLT